MKGNLRCEGCSSEIIIPDLTNDQKQEFINLKRAGLNIQLTQLIKNVTQLNLQNSKALMLHINPVYGKCHRCNYIELNTENIACPKCKSINTNWV